MKLSEMIAAASAIVEPTSKAHGLWKSSDGQFQIRNIPVVRRNFGNPSKVFRRLKFELFNGQKFVLVSRANFESAVLDAEFIAKSMIAKMEEMA